MDDRTIALIALVIAVLALAAGWLHALQRDSDHGGNAHVRGYDTIGALGLGAGGDPNAPGYAELGRRRMLVPV